MSTLDCLFCVSFGLLRLQFCSSSLPRLSGLCLPDAQFEEPHTSVFPRRSAGFWPPDLQVNGLQGALLPVFRAPLLIQLKFSFQLHGRTAAGGSRRKAVLWPTYAVCEIFISISLSLLCFYGILHLISRLKYC